jgi:hypothetical protein
LSEFTRLRKKLGAVQAQLVESVRLFTTLRDKGRREDKLVRIAIFPLLIGFALLDYFELVVAWRSAFGVAFGLIFFVFFNLQRQADINASVITCRILMKDLISLGQPKALAFAFASATYGSEQDDDLRHSILAFERDMNLLEQMGIATRSYSLEPIWEVTLDDHAL